MMALQYPLKLEVYQNICLWKVRPGIPEISSCAKFAYRGSLYIFDLPAK